MEMMFILALGSDHFGHSVENGLERGKNEARQMLLYELFSPTLRIRTFICFVCLFLWLVLCSHQLKKKVSMNNGIVIQWGHLGP
jgi:hypothetical protein